MWNNGSLPGHGPGRRLHSPGGPALVDGARMGVRDRGRHPGQGQGQAPRTRPVGMAETVVGDSVEGASGLNQHVHQRVTIG